MKGVSQSRELWRLGSESKSLYKLLSAQHLLIPTDLAYPEYVPRYMQ